MKTNKYLIFMIILPLIMVFHLVHNYFITYLLFLKFLLLASFINICNLLGSLLIFLMTFAGPIIVNPCLFPNNAETKLDFNLLNGSSPELVFTTANSIPLKSLFISSIVVLINSVSSSFSNLPSNKTILFSLARFNSFLILPMDVKWFISEYGTNCNVSILFHQSK